MTIRALRSLMALTVAVSMAGFFQTTGRGNQVQTKENGRMDGLVIGVFPLRKAILPGESFPVESVFENRSGAPVEVTGEDDPSEFAYELLLAKDRSLRYRVSRHQREQRRARDLKPPRAVQPDILAPGENKYREEDVAELHNEDFVPGKYLIRASYPFEGTPESQSGLSPFTVLVPRIESFSSSVCDHRKVLVTAYAHRREDGGVLIMQREALADPRESIAFRRLQLEPGPPVQVAVAVDAMNAGNGRWFGWLRDGLFEAAVGWGNRLIVRSKPVRVGSAETVLLSPGFQVDVGVGLFGFVSTANGVVRFKAVRTSAAGSSPAVDIELAPGQIRSVRWNYRAESGISVIWQNASGHVYRRSLDLQGKSLDGGPESTSAVVPVSWGVSPLGSPALHTVVKARDGSYFFHDLGTGVPGASEVSPVQLPRLPAGMPQDPSFVFCTNTEGKIRIVTAGAGKIWSVLVPGEPGAWEPVGDARQPLFLHAFSPTGRKCWSEWFERDVGLRRAVLP